MRTLRSYVAYSLLIASAVIGFASGYVYDRIQNPDCIVESKRLFADVEKVQENAKRLRSSTERLERNSEELMLTISRESKSVLERVTGIIREEIRNLGERIEKE